MRQAISRILVVAVVAPYFCVAGGLPLYIHLELEHGGHAHHACGGEHSPFGPGFAGVHHSQDGFASQHSSEDASDDGCQLCDQLTRSGTKTTLPAPVSIWKYDDSIVDALHPAEAECLASAMPFGCAPRAPPFA